MDLEEAENCLRQVFIYWNGISKSPICSFPSFNLRLSYMAGESFQMKSSVVT